VVGLSVCVSVCWSRSRAVQKRLTHSRCRLDGLSQLGPRKHVLAEGADPLREGGNFGGVLPIEKHGESLFIAPSRNSWTDFNDPYVI